MTIKGKKPVFLSILNGAFIFVADLVRSLRPLPVRQLSSNFLRMMVVKEHGECYDIDRNGY